MGFALAAYPLTLMAAAMKAMLAALDALRDGRPRDELLLEFGELKQRIGFDEYYEVSGKYDTSRRM
jgi:2-methylisocitrate lyase-like PEP mutase family enzyme